MMMGHLVPAVQDDKNVDDDEESGQEGLFCSENRFAVGERSCQLELI